MALFRVQVRKAINEGGIAVKWSNQYYVETLSDLTAAQTGVQIWEDAEKLFHRPYVFLYEVYATSVTAEDEVYTVLPYTGTEDRGVLGGSGDIMPLFNVVRVDLPTTGGGRPSRKFYRCPLMEGDQVAGNLVAGVLPTGLEAGLTALVAIPGVVDESGNTFSGHVTRGITSRRLGKFAPVAVPVAPPV